MVERLTPPELDWTEDGAPVSRTFGDVYFSREGGLAETRAVFLAGCGLPDAWVGRRHFTVAELGFGTGLNILALLDLWRTHRPMGGHLHVWSVEAHPLDRDAMVRAHAAWPELADVSGPILDRWPDLTPGLHRLDLPDLDATLDLAFAPAKQALADWAGLADVWFLDGFAPSANAAMWSDEVLGLVAARSAPGARAATFTVAGQVRRGLAAGGFAVEKRPGHGRKRERLEAVFPGPAADTPAPPRVGIVGAGIAGAALVRAFNALGLRPTVIEADSPGAGASGAPAALVTPAVDAGLTPAAVLAAQAFQRATGLYRQTAPAAVLAEGVLRLTRDERDRVRLETVAAQPVWPDGALTLVEAGEIADRLGEPAATPALALRDALVIEPLSVLDTWLAGADRITGEVAAVAPDAVTLADGTVLTFDAVVLAAGWGSERLGAETLRPVRGQLAWADAVEAPPPAVWGPGYAIPTRTGVLIGATHDRGETGSEARPADTDRLKAALAADRPALATRLEGRALDARAAVRATVRDHRPLCGLRADGVWSLTGLGGRGFSWAPLLAEHLAAAITATPSPLSRASIALVDPRREDAAASGNPGGAQALAG